MNKLIGVAGKARAGKDTFVRGLIQQGYTRAAFADALKQVTALIANEPLHYFTDDELKEEFTPALGMTRRRALQGMGQSVRETLGDGTWVNRVMRTWEDSGKIPVAISDCRYPNEAKAIRAAGGIVVVIERPDNAGLTGEASTHSSEQPLPFDLVDVYIRNDGTVEDLHGHAARVAHWLASSTGRPA